MREHMGLFRGKRIDNDEWVEGWLVIKKDPILDVTYYFILAYGKGESYVTWYPVDPDTVGECTGLRDKNGKLIFEGDIVEGHCHSAWSHCLQRCVVAYGRDRFEARHHIDGIDSEYYTYRVLFSKDVVVVGNVTDNPELLKGGEGDG